MKIKGKLLTRQLAMKRNWTRVARGTVVANGLSNAVRLMLHEHRMGNN